MWADQPRILSRPIRIRWAGWETDTLALQQAGWSLSAHQDPVRGEMQLAFENREIDVRGVSQRIDFDYVSIARDFPEAHLPPISAQMANRLYLSLSQPFVTFQPIDAMPSFVDMWQPKTLEDLAHFAVPLARTQEIIIPEPNVTDLLDKILAMQDPAKHAYFERRVRDDRMMREGVPRQKFHAQIVSFAA